MNRLKIVTIILVICFAASGCKHTVATSKYVQSDTAEINTTENNTKGATADKQQVSNKTAVDVKWNESGKSENEEAAGNTKDNGNPAEPADREKKTGINTPETENNKGTKENTNLEDITSGSNSSGTGNSNGNNGNNGNNNGNNDENGQDSGESIKLDFETLDKLDNKKLSWWIKLYGEGKTPGISSTAKKLIEENDGIYLGDTSEKVIYLTFDEGYENGYTPMILDALKNNDVKAVFFVTWPYVKKNKELVERMFEEGHIVGSHTVYHKILPEVDNKTLEEELCGFEEKFRSMFGKRIKYFRPPEGAYSEKVLAAAKQLGYKTVFWSFAYRDFDVNNQKGADYAHKMVMDNLHNGAVILLHAVSKDNAEALDRIIKDIKAQGYEIRLLDL